MARHHDSERDYRPRKERPTGTVGNAVAGTLIAFVIIVVLGLGARWFVLDYYNKAVRDNDAMHQRREAAEEQQEKQRQAIKDKADKFVGPKREGVK